MKQKIQNENDWLAYVVKQASLKGVKKIAVENFLGTVGNNSDLQSALGNLAMDAGMYNWNYRTYEVIQRGIIKYFREVKGVIA